MDRDGTELVAFFNSIPFPLFLQDTEQVSPSSQIISTHTLHLLAFGFKRFTLNSYIFN